MQGYGGFIVSHVLGDVRSDSLVACGVALSPVTDFGFCGNCCTLSLSLSRSLNINLFVTLIYSEKISTETEASTGTKVHIILVCFWSI